MSAVTFFRASKRSSALVVRPGEGFGHTPIFADHHALRQAVTKSGLEVVQVVRGRHLHRAGTEFHLGVLIGDQGESL